MSKAPRNLRFMSNSNEWVCTMPARGGVYRQWRSIRNEVTFLIAKINGLMQRREHHSTQNSHSSETKSVARTSRSRKERSMIIMDGYRPYDTTSVVQDPANLQLRGFLWKRRNRPLTGWHKRFFVLENGFLEYMRHSDKTHRSNRVHGRCDLAQCFISYDEANLRVHIEAGDRMYIVKAKDEETFYRWIEAIREQRIIRQKLVLEKGEKIAGAPPRQLNDDQRIFLHTLKLEMSSVKNYLETAKSLLPADGQAVEFVENAMVKVNRLTAGLDWINSGDQGGDSTPMGSLFFDALDYMYDDRSSSNSNENSEHGATETPPRS